MRVLETKEINKLWYFLKWKILISSPFLGVSWPQYLHQKVKNPILCDIYQGASKFKYDTFKVPSLSI